MQLRSRVLAGREVWRTISPLVKSAKRVWAAVAYLGRSGADRLPLKPGDQLVVDMSLAAVRQGVTDPREIRKLLRRRVGVSSRSALHAKLIVAGDWLVIGSMNASRNSADYLDEAALLTNSRSSVAAARKLIVRWSGEPVLPDQLREALAEYRPPKFKAAVAPRQRKRARKRVRRARLWLVGHLRPAELPSEELGKATAATRKAADGFARARGTSLNSVHYTSKPRYFEGIRRGDWVLQVVRNQVEAPGRVVGKAHYSRGKEKERYLLIVEERTSRPASWAEFKRAHKRATGHSLRSQRTKGFADDAEVDSLLACWSRKTWNPLPLYFKR